MKIQKISLRKHFFFGNVDIDLTGANGKPFDTVVFAGNNGCGKTTLLETLLSLLTGYKAINRESSVDLSLESITDSKLIKPHLWKDPVEKKFNGSNKNSLATFFKQISDIPVLDRPKVVYLPAEISFENLKSKETAFEYKYAFKNVIDKKHVNDIPTFLSSMIKDAVFKNKELPAETSIKKVCSEINQIFDQLEIDAKLIGLAEEGEKLPEFINSSEQKFDINGLSSGEKQLFARALTLKMVKANNSIILIDEPEISLHPRWQQKILRVYESIGKNNQVIIATHSPHILSACGKESSFLLARESGQIKVFDYKQLNSIYGKPVSVVLMDFMGLKTLRDPEIEVQFEALREMVRNNKSDSAIFKEKMADLVEIVGEIDEDIILLKMELARIEAKRQKKNA